jgi:hypothetical protein
LDGHSLPQPDASGAPSTSVPPHLQNAPLVYTCAPASDCLLPSSSPCHPSVEMRAGKLDAQGDACPGLRATKAMHRHCTVIGKGRVDVDSKANLSTPSALQRDSYPTTTRSWTTAMTVAVSQSFPGVTPGVLHRCFSAARLPNKAHPQSKKEYFIKANKRSLTTFCRLGQNLPSFPNYLLSLSSNSQCSSERRQVSCSDTCARWATARATAWPMAARVCQKYPPRRNFVSRESVCVIC